MIDGFPLIFFFPLVVHALAGLTTGVTGALAFCAPKHRGSHYRWGTHYLWAYTVVFLTAVLLSIQRWEADAYLFFLAVIGYGLALFGYGARGFRQAPSIKRVPGMHWVVVHIVGMIGSYVVLWTAFSIDNAHPIAQSPFTAHALGASQSDRSSISRAVPLSLCSRSGCTIHEITHGKKELV